jgi:DMSO reductase anchor subunit
MQIKPFEFMVKYTSNTRWAEGSGALIAVAFFLGGISGGLYLMSLYFNSLLGMFIGWLLVLLVGIVDMAPLHKPLRFWRMLLRPNTSWIARGFIFIVFFIGCAALQLAY